MLTTWDFYILYYHFRQTEIVVTMVLPFSVGDAEKLSIPERFFVVILAAKASHELFRDNGTHRIPYPKNAGKNTLYNVHEYLIISVYDHTTDAFL